MAFIRVFDDISKIVEYKKSGKQKRDYSVWVFGEWFGNRCYDNSMYFANYIVSNHPEIKAYWIAKSTADTSPLDRRIIILEMDTKECIDICQLAGVAIMSEGLLDFSSQGYNYFNNAITINLWHGVPWKKIGADNTPANRFFIKRYASWLNNAIGVDYYLATSDLYERVLETAFLKKKGKVILSGQPRNQGLYDERFIIESKKKIISHINKEYNTRYDLETLIVTYMPTFRDRVIGDYSFIDSKIQSELSDYLASKNAILLEKSHYVNSNNTNSVGYGVHASRIHKYSGEGAQELLASSDVLITDYSSCFFDYLLLDRPIIHFLYDYEYYAKEDRGLYYSAEEVVAGEVAYNDEELMSILEDSIDNPMKMHNRRTDIRNKFLQYEDIDSCKKIYEYISGLIAN